MSGSAVVRGAWLRAGVLVLCAALAWTLSGVGVARTAWAHATATPTAGRGAGAGEAGRAGLAAPPRRASAELAAVRTARLLGRPVQVAGEQSATSTVEAEPDGLLSDVITAVPTRVKRGNGWVNLDTALTRGPGGSLAPRAAEE